MPAYERFDAAVISPSGKYAAVYEKLCNKGAIVDISEFFEPRVLREIKRHPDNAEAFDYPVLLFELPDGREAIVHCPDQPDHLVIEDLVSGARVAASTSGSFKTMDYYYSRLAINRSGTRLLSAGWAWHPCDLVVLYDLQSVLDDPEELDQDDALLITPTEANGAAFVGDDLLIITGAIDPVYAEDDTWLPPGGMALYDLVNRKCVCNTSLDMSLGTLMPVNTRLAVDFLEHPKLIDIETAEIHHCWEDIDSGMQESSILWQVPPVPPIAIDVERGRFAVASDTSIRVVEISA